MIEGFIVSDQYGCYHYVMAGNRNNMTMSLTGPHNGFQPSAGRSFFAHVYRPYPSVEVLPDSHPAIVAQKRIGDRPGAWGYGTLGRGVLNRPPESVMAWGWLPRQDPYDRASPRLKHTPMRGNPCAGAHTQSLASKAGVAEGPQAQRTGTTSITLTC